MTRLETQRDVCLHMYTVKESKDTRKHLLLIPVFKSYVFDSIYRSGKHMTGIQGCIQAGIAKLHVLLFLTCKVYSIG